MPEVVLVMKASPCTRSRCARFKTGLLQRQTKDCWSSLRLTQDSTFLGGQSDFIPGTPSNGGPSLWLFCLESSTLWVASPESSEGPISIGSSKEISPGLGSRSAPRLITQSNKSKHHPLLQVISLIRVP